MVSAVSRSSQALPIVLDSSSQYSSAGVLLHNVTWERLERLDDDLIDTEGAAVNRVRQLQYELCAAM